MSRARKPQKRSKQKPAPMLPEAVVRTLELATLKLGRANDLLSAIDHVASVGTGEVNLGALAIAARDLIDKVLDDLAPLRRGLKTQGGES